MNEEEKKQEPMPEEKATLDDKKKNALLRYITILFAVAFLFVLFSLLLQMRDSQATISELNQSSASALQNVVLLQENNQKLQEENTALQAQLEELQQQVDELTSEDVDAEELTAELERLQKEADAAKGKTQSAYELLLQAMELQTPGSQEGNVAFSKALDNLESLKDYLGETGLKVYNRLLELEGEEGE